MIQLYILFMITPLFFTLAQVDRTAIEAARDLGGNWWRTFVAVILPQTLPGIVIGSIFIFVLTMGEYGTVLVVGQNYVQSVGTIVNSYIVGRSSTRRARPRRAARRGADRRRLRDHALLQPARGPLDERHGVERVGAAGAAAGPGDHPAGRSKRDLGEVGPRALLLALLVFLYGR
jgi:hypothetical protein